MKKLSPNITNPVLQSFLLSRFGMVLTNWLFQGMRYMASFERFYRLVCEAILFVPLLLLFMAIIHPLYAMFFAFLASHSLMWFINGHLFSLLRMKENSAQDLIHYIDKFYDRVQKNLSLDGAVVFGGLCQNRFHKYSDLDVRFLKTKGFLNSIKACNYAFFERLLALKMAFPLEIYVLDNFDELDKEDKSQISPIILLDAKGKLKGKYPKARDYITFRAEFLLKFVK